LKEEYGDRLSARSLALIRAVFGHPSIGKRHFAFDRPEELLRESLDERIARFTRWAVGLSEQAIRRALGEAGVSPQDVAGLIVNTCTGYICPGLSTYLIERMDFSPKLRVYDLVGSGCGGAIPNLELAAAVLRSRAEGVVVSVSVEICSATFQMDNDMSLILSNALFGDGAAAAVLWREPRGYDLVSSASTYATAHREAIRYVHRNGQLHNQLSPQLPELVGKAAADVVSNLLEPYALRPRDVPHWALHTGGEKIVNAIRDEVGLSEEQLKTTRDILREYGNMSSPTVLFVLRRIMDNGVSPGDWSVLLAFGAGLSAHGFLLRKESSAPCGSLTAVPGDAG
jgi:predicted naringenin-chalcone synthase